MKNFPSELTFAYAVLNKIIVPSLAYGVLLFIGAQTIA